MDEFTLIQDQDLVIVDDGVETVSDGEDSAVSELSLNCVLDQMICLHINTCCCFIKQENFVTENY